MSDKFNRRDFLRIASVAAAGGVVAACTPKTEPTAEPMTSEDTEPTMVPETSAEEIVVKYWVQWPEFYTNAFMKLAESDDFKDMVGSNITVEAKAAVDEDALLTAAAGGTPPDGAANYNYLDYMAREALRPLDDYIDASTNIKKDDYLEAVWDIGSYSGKQYGLPANECFVQQGMCYNARLVEEAGLDPETPPVTYDELLEWHKAITKFDNSGNVLVVGYDPTDFMGETIWGSSAWDVSTAWGFDWFDENTGAFNLNNASMVEYFETAKKFVDIIGVDKLGAFRSAEGQGGWGPAFYAEVLAVMLDGYWEPGEMAAIKPELSEVNRCTWMPVPESRRGEKAQGAGGHIIMIFKEAENPEPMYKISEYLSTPTACDVIFSEIGWLPAVKTYLDQVDPNTYNGLEFFLRSAKEATYWGTPEKCPITNFVGTIYPQLREQVFREELTAEEAAEQLQLRSEEEYKNAGFGS